MARVAKSVVITNKADRIIRLHRRCEEPSGVPRTAQVDREPERRSEEGRHVVGLDVRHGGGRVFRSRRDGDYESGKQFGFKTTTGIQSTFTYSAEPQGNGAKVSIDVTYDVPQSLLSKMQTGVVEKLNDAEGARAIENLKAILDQ